MIKFRYKHLRSYVPGNVPSPANILEGQFAINIPDKKIYTKDNLGNIIDLTDYVPTDILENNYLKQGTLPITQIGDMGGISSLNFVPNGVNTIVNNIEIPILLHGRNYIYPITTSTVNVSYQVGVPVYCYFELQTGDIVLIFSNTELSEAAGRVYIGTVTHNGTNFTINFNTVTRIDVFRLSTTKVGSSIPVSIGFPSSSGTFDASWGL